MKIAIIGAGLAGASLANLLHNAGINCTVIEKSKGRGGRMNTKRLEWGHCDMGAQYFTARDPQFKSVVEDWLASGITAHWDFTPHAINDGRLITSPDETQRFVGTPDMNSVVKLLLQDQTLLLNTRVAQITKDSGKWYLWDNNLDLIGVFDWVVSTLPAEQARELFHNQNEILSQIPDNVHASCWAVSIATRGKVAKDVEGVFSEEPFSWLSRQSARPERSIPDLNEGSEGDERSADDIWNMHFSTEFTKRNLHAKPAELQLQAFEFLQSLLVKSGKTKQLEYVEGYSHYWRYARLSNAYQIQIDQDGISDIIFEPEQQVAVIGDWTQGGKIQGAYLSALKCFNKVQSLVKA